MVIYNRFPLHRGDLFSKKIGFHGLSKYFVRVEERLVSLFSNEFFLANLFVFFFSLHSDMDSENCKVNCGILFCVVHFE